MADIIIRGFLEKIHHLGDQGGILQVSEFKKGFKKANGEIVDDKYITWRVLFKKGQGAYLDKHFNTGMLVKIKGEVYPYSIVQGKLVDGTTVLMDSCVMDSYPRSYAKKEMMMIKDSRENGDGVPDLEDYNSPDF